MKKAIGIATTISIIASLLSGCPVKPDVEESSNYVEIGGIKFRKRGSINTDILFAGVRRNAGVNTFDPKFLPVMENEIKARQVTEAFNEETGKVAFEAAAKAGIEVAEGSINASAGAESKVTGKYSVFTLFDVNDFVAELNSEENSKNLDLLKRYKDPRIITSIATVFDRDSSRKISASGNVSLNIKNPKVGNPEFSIKSEISGESVAKLSNGTVFAFEYARICWEKVDGKVRVATIEVDRPGIDDNCPPGTNDNASKL